MQNRSVWLFWVAILVFAPVVCHAQEATPSPSPAEVEAESVVVSATRFDIPLDQSPASASVISSEELEQKQIQRVSDALREVPGLSVVQTGVPGQLTSVFTRGLRSEHTQVLLDGIPINQGLQGAFNFANRGCARAAKHNLRTTCACRCDSNLHQTRQWNAGRNVRLRGWLLRHVSGMVSERRQSR